jgi:cytoskeletal protein CcmA (bactofilin family)
VVSTLLVVLKNVSMTMASTGERKSRKNNPPKGEFKKMPIKPEDITIISETSGLKGKLKMPGNVIILGSFTGSIISRTLEIFKDGKTFGSIEAENVTIAGYFEGEMACSGLLTIAKTGKVRGRVAYGTLSVELGGLLDAKVFQLESTDTKLLPFQRKTVHFDK